MRVSEAEWQLRFRGDPDAAKHETLFSLRIFVPQTHPRLVAMTRAHIVTTGGPARLVEALDEAVEWLRTICEAPPHYAYELSELVDAFASPLFVRLIPKRPGTAGGQPRRPGGPLRATQWRKLDSGNRLHAYLALSRLGDEEYLPELRVLTERPLYGGSVKRAATFYWLVRAREAGLDVESKIRAKAPRLTEDDMAGLHL